MSTAEVRATTVPCDDTAWNAHLPHRGATERRVSDARFLENPLRTWPGYPSSGFSSGFSPGFTIPYFSSL